MACNLLLPHKDNIPNKFIILRETHIQTIKPYHLPGARSGLELKTSRLHSFIMANVSHAQPLGGGIGMCARVGLAFYRTEYVNTSYDALVSVL